MKIGDLFNLYAATIMVVFACLLPCAGQTLSVSRTITDSAGRKLEGTILTKDAGSIQFRRTSDGKEFDLPLAKLSAEDQTFIAGLITPPVKKPKVLLLFKDEIIQTRLEKAGFAVTVPPPQQRMNPDGTPDVNVYDAAIDQTTDDEIKKFDVVWINSWVINEKHFARLLGLVPTCNRVVWCRPFKPIGVEN